MNDIVYLIIEYVSYNDYETKSVLYASLNKGKAEKQLQEFLHNSEETKKKALKCSECPLNSGKFTNKYLSRSHMEELCKSFETNDYVINDRNRDGWQCVHEIGVGDDVENWDYKLEAIALEK